MIELESNNKYMMSCFFNAKQRTTFFMKKKIVEKRHFKKNSRCPT